MELYTFLKNQSSPYVYTYEQLTRRLAEKIHMK